MVRAFAGPAPPEPSRADAPPGVSAVLAAVHASAAGAALLYTRRARTLRSHAGEISFPGGRVDPEDHDPLAAALREAEEEVGLASAEVEVLGHLTDFLTHRDILVVCYVGRVRGTPPKVPASHEEVEEILEVPVAWLLDPARYEARRAAGFDRAVHYWHLPSCVLWGITGELTARLLQRVWGWRPPREARIVTSIDEFLPHRRS